MSEEQLNPEMQEQPVPFGFLIPLTQALEARIDSVSYTHLRAHET